MGVADDQDHAGAQGCDIAVVVLQGGDGGVVRGGDGREGFAALDFVMLYRGMRRMGGCAGGLGCGVVVGSGGTPGGYLGFARGSSYGKVEIQDLSSG